MKRSAMMTAGAAISPLSTHRRETSGLTFEERWVGERFDVLDPLIIGDRLDVDPPLKIRQTPSQFFHMGFQLSDLVFKLRDLVFRNH
jgi:hypothetical protein